MTVEFRLYAAFGGLLTLDAELRALGTTENPQFVQLVLNDHANERGLECAQWVAAVR